MSNFIFSEGADPMVAHIRATVPKPDHLPLFPYTDAGYSLRFACDKCPMGFLPEASNGAPGDAGQIAGALAWPDHLKESIRHFGRDWDSRKAPQAQAMMDILWGVEVSP